MLSAMTDCQQMCHDKALTNKSYFIFTAAAPQHACHTSAQHAWHSTPHYMILPREPDILLSVHRQHPSGMHALLQNFPVSVTPKCRCLYTWMNCETPYPLTCTYTTCLTTETDDWSVLTSCRSDCTPRGGVLVHLVRTNTCKDHITMALRWHAFARLPLSQPRRGAGRALLGADMHRVRLWPHEVSRACSWGLIEAIELAKERSCIF